MDDKDKNWPAWFYGPNGQRDVFERQSDVPASWQDHPEKVEAITSELTAPAETQNDASDADTGTQSSENRDMSNTLDRDGWPWSVDLHAATQSLTKDGLWRMKVGVSRPAPKEGYPKPVLDL